MPFILGCVKKLYGHKPGHFPSVLIYFRPYIFKGHQMASLIKRPEVMRVKTAVVITFIFIDDQKGIVCLVLYLLVLFDVLKISITY